MSGVVAISEVAFFLGPPCSRQTRLCRELLVRARSEPPFLPVDTIVSQTRTEMTMR